MGPELGRKDDGYVLDGPTSFPLLHSFPRWPGSGPLIMASYVYPPVVPPGQTPPLAVVTESDHRAWIFIAAALGVSMTLLASGIRAFIRCGTKSVWGLDDATLGVSTVCTFAAYRDGLDPNIIFVASFLPAIITRASGNVQRAGQFATDDSWSQTKPRRKGNLIEVPTFVWLLTTKCQLYYSSNLIYVFSLGCSRVAMILFLRRLTPVRIHVRIITALLGAEAAWTTAVFLVVALQCSVNEPWALGRRCGSGWVSCLPKCASSFQPSLTSSSL